MVMPEIKRCRLADQLTTEILIEILTKLPLKTILVCRSICKSWNDLILQPFFVDLHRSFSCPVTILLAHHSNKTSRQKRLRIGLITQNTSMRLRYDVTGTIMKGIPDLEIVGSCNGLVCLSGYNPPDYFSESKSDNNNRFRLVVCNPILESHLILPVPPQEPEVGLSTQLGFGYIRSTRQYKAVIFSYKYLLSHVCTIQGGHCGDGKKKLPPSASAWRTIHLDGGNGGVKACGFWLPPHCTFLSYQTFYNGSIIWIAKTYNDADGQCLILFDIEKEETQTVTLPPYIPKKNDMIDEWYFKRLSSIGVYYDYYNNDHLYFCEQHCTCSMIWVLDDYKRINKLKPKWVIHLPEKIKLFKVQKDGRLLIGMEDSTLAYYDPNTRLVERIMKLQIPVDTSCLAVDIPNILGFLL